jgi:hypothetical protein
MTPRNPIHNGRRTSQIQPSSDPTQLDKLAKDHKDLFDLVNARIDALKKQYEKECGKFSQEVAQELSNLYPSLKFTLELIGGNEAFKIVPLPVTMNAGPSERLFEDQIRTLKQLTEEFDKHWPQYEVLRMYAKGYARAKEKSSYQIDELKRDLKDAKRDQRDRDEGCYPFSFPFPRGYRF